MIHLSIPLAANNRTDNTGGGFTCGKFIKSLSKKILSFTGNSQRLLHSTIVFVRWIRPWKASLHRKSFLIALGGISLTTRSKDITPVSSLMAKQVKSSDAIDNALSFTISLYN